MKWPARLLAAVLAYAAASWLLFGDPLTPIFLASRLHMLPVWPLVLVAFVSVPLPWALARKFGDAYFPALYLMMATLMGGLWVDGSKHRALKGIDKDDAYVTSIFHWLRLPALESRYTLHAAYLKDCRVFAWSHEQWGFYELSLGVARNVLPPRWYQACPNLSDLPG